MISTLTVSDLYARAGRSPSTSTTATPGATPGRRVQTDGGGKINDDLARAFVVSAASNPVYGAVVLGLLLVALGFIARRVGTLEEFREIRLSVYNVIVISLAAMIGILFWKVLFTKFPVPHITPAVLAV